LQKNSIKKLTVDLNSPEGTGTPNTIKKRPDGWPEAFITNFFNLSDSSITTKNLFPHIRFKFYKHNTNIISQKEAAETAKNTILAPILSPQSSTSELFNTFSSLISIPSIMIAVHGEVVQYLFSNIFKGSQISEVFKSSETSNQQ
jgi:hypothetical protein